MNEDMIQKRRAFAPAASLMVAWGAAVIAGLLASILTSARLPTLIEAVVMRPLQIVALAIVATLSVSVFARFRFDQAWQEVITALPLALALAVVLSWFGVWNDGSGTVALSLGDAMAFVFTLGAIPTALGPEIVVRGTAVALAIILAVRVVRRRAGAGSAAMTFVAAWIPAALLLLTQTWIAQVASWFRESPILNSLDALRVLGMIHTNSYWSNFQADRFFAGIGQQLETGIALSSSAAVFLVGCAALKLALFRLSPWNRPGVLMALGRRLAGAPFLLFVSPLAVGLLIGFRSQRIAWNGLDVIAILVLIVVFAAWFVQWMFGRDLEDLSKDEREHPERPLPSGVVRPDELEGLREVLVCVAVIGAFLLGWPVLLVTLALLGLGWIASSAGFGWAQSRRDRVLVWAAMSSGLVIMGGAFAVRSSIVPTGLFPLAVAWAAVTATVFLVRLYPLNPAKPLNTPAMVAAAGILVALILKTPIVIALVALLLIGQFFLQKNPENWRRYAFLSLLAFGWIATLLSQFKLP